MSEPIKSMVFVRRQFEVEAVQVTRQNMADVAEWCGGRIIQAVPKGKTAAVDCIKIRVLGAISERHTQAFVNDWVTYGAAFYKIFNPKAFEHAFEPKMALPNELGEGLVSAEYHDDQTMNKVVEAVHRSFDLAGSGFPMPNDIILSLQNAGILFRERKN
jgi:hypothetical protein